MNAAAASALWCIKHHIVVPAGLSVNSKCLAVARYGPALTRVGCHRTCDLTATMVSKGGGVYVSSNAEASFFESTFHDNLAVEGSAIFLAKRSTVTSISGCLFYNNTQLDLDQGVPRARSPSRDFIAETLRMFADRCGACRWC